MKRNRVISVLLTVMMIALCLCTGMDAKQVSAADDVAEVNGTKYTSLVDAFAAANGAEITILKNINEPSWYLFSMSYAGARLNLNGFEVHVDSIDVYGGSVSISNGSLILDGMIKTGNTNVESEDLNLTNVKVQAKTIQWIAAGELKLTNSTVNCVGDGIGAFYVRQVKMDHDSYVSIKNVSSINSYGVVSYTDRTSTKTYLGNEEFKKLLPKGYTTYGEPNSYTPPTESGGVYSGSYNHIGIVKEGSTTYVKDLILCYNDLNNAKIASFVDITNPADSVYDGTEKRPVVTVTMKGQVLEENVDYKLTYTDNTNAGTATVLIEGLAAANVSGIVTKHFTIAKADRPAPTGLTPTDETVADKNDGVISNVTTEMQYSTDQTNWKNVTGATLTGLADGDYYVRYAETANYNVSPATKVTVKPGAVATTAATTEAPTTAATTAEATTTTEKATTEADEEDATDEMSDDESDDESDSEEYDTTAAADDDSKGSSVKTGDVSPVGLGFGLLAFASCAIAVLYVGKRKDEKLK